MYVQHTAGINSGFADDAYVAAGARILPAIEDVYGIAEMIVKVKEPIASEYPFGTQRTACLHLLPFRIRRGSHPLP